MFNRFLAALAAFTMALSGALAVSSPAQAAFSDCPSNYVCIWAGTNATGSRFQWSKQTILNGTNNGIRLGSGITNRGYSFYNRLTGGGNWAVYLFDSYNCVEQPWRRSLSQGQQATAQGSDWGGRVSSFQLWNAAPLTC